MADLNTPRALFFGLLLIALQPAILKAQSGLWTQKPDLPAAARTSATGFSIGSILYIGTGVDADDNRLQDFWAFDTETNTWAQIADFPGPPRSGAAATFSIGGKGYVCGGSGVYGDLKDLWQYDPATNTWAQKANLSGVARTNATSFSIGTKGYVGLGGHSSSGGFTFLNDFWEYDPATNTWSQKAAMPGTSRWSAAGFSIGSKGYVTTGSYQGNLFDDLWEFDPIANAWTQRADFAGAPRSGASAFSIAGKGYVGMGYVGSFTFENDLWEYDPIANTWTQKANMDGATRHNAVGSSVAGKGYVCTGHLTSALNGPLSAELWVFDADPAITCSINDPSLCADNGSFDIDFTTSAAFGAGNIFTAQLSDPLGGYASPTTIGTIAGTTSGTITASIPLGTPAGSSYRIRVVSSAPVMTGTENADQIDIAAYAPWYFDDDGDGHGDPAINMMACAQPVGYVAALDCDDTDPDVYPGAVCDDGDATTGNDSYDAICTCVGQLIDCLGVPGGDALPGSICNDCDPTTTFDTYDADCICTGHVEDTLIFQAGGLDPSFDPGMGFNDRAVSMALQPDGKVIVAGRFTSFDGSTKNHIARLETDGSLDATYATGGGFNGFTTSDLALQPDGKVIVSGQFTSFNGTPRDLIARLNANGSLDASFDPGPDHNPTGTDKLALQPNGEVLVGGGFLNFNGAEVYDMVRLKANGTFDPTYDIGLGFDFPSDLNGDPADLAIQPNGRVVAVGGFLWYDGLSPFAGTICRGIIRLGPNGGLDNSFEHGGSYFDPDDGFTGVPLVIALQPDGRILVGGDFTSYETVARNRIIRLNEDGTVDNTFVPGTGFNDVVTALALQADGKIIVGGDFTSFNGVSRERIARLNDDGSLDVTFQPCSGFNGQVSDLVIQSDGRVLACGNFTSFGGVARDRIARLFTKDATCLPSQLTTTPDPIVSCGATNLYINATDTLWATEVPGANKYQFHFTNISGQPAYVRNCASPTRDLTLGKWSTKPLKPGRSYNVTVHASFDDGATYCPYSTSCTIQISNAHAPEFLAATVGMIEEDAPLALFPNPSAGGSVRVHALVPSDGRPVTLEVFDMHGQRVVNKALPLNNGEVDAVLDLDPGLADGLYLVILTSGDRVFSERLMIARQ